MIDGWLIIPNWSRWQSRADRRDPWIKSYVDQLDRDEYLNLTLAERGLLADIRHAYSRHNGQLRAKMLPGLVHARVRINQLDRLTNAGFINVVAAKPPPIGGESAARAREEKEEEKERASLTPTVVSYAEPSGPNGVSEWAGKVERGIKSVG